MKKLLFAPSKRNTLSAFARLRVVAALAFAIGATLILLARAAAPESATISATTTTPVTWLGSAPGGSSPGGELTCVDGVNCDVFKLTVTGTEADWANNIIALNFGWALPATDYDFYIHKDSVTGPRTNTGINDGAPATADNAAIDPAATGVGDYFVHVVYFSVVGPSDQYQGSATVIPRTTNVRTATHSSGGITFSPNVPLKAPVAARDGEPSIRTDYKGNSYTGGIRGVPAGVDLWYVNLDPTSTKFDPLMRFPAYRGQPDGTTNQTPADIGADGGGDIDLAVGFPPLPGETEPAVPFLAYSSLTLANISSGNTTNRGESFNLNPAGNLTGGPPGDDRQWHEFLGSNSVYLLYRTVAPAIAQIQRSDDGGFTYGPTVAAGLIGQVGCIDVHQASGTVYASGSTGNVAVGTPTVAGQPPTTYTIRQAATDPNGVAHLFFVVKVADDGTPNGTAYVLYSNQTNIYIKHSTDKGATWSSPVQVNPPTGPYANNVNLFPWMETGPTPGSVGVVWYGTTAQVNNDDAKWKVFFAQSFNANSDAPAFQIGEVTEPEHFIHGSNISEMGLNPTGGSNRNLIDYFQVSFDPLGAAVVAYTDDHNDFDGNTFIARQIGGPSIRGGNLPAIVPGPQLGPPPANPNLEPTDAFPPAQPGPDGAQVTDFIHDVQTALVTRVPNPDPLDIESVKYETIGAAPNQRIKTTIKVTQMLPVPPAGSFWRASFAANCPHSVLDPTGQYTFGISDDGDQFYLQANTSDEGMQTFEYGKAVRNPDGSISYTPIGAADAGAFNIADKTITMEVTLAKLNAVLAAANRPLLQNGSVVAGLRARAVTIEIDLPPPAGRQGRRDLTRGGTQFVIGGSSIAPVSVVSRKQHGSAGAFDIPLPLTGTPGIENRVGQPGAAQHQVVVTFANPVAVASGATVDGAGGGNVSNISVSGSVVTIDLAGVGNAQTITINLQGVTDGTNTGDVAIPMSLLLGDTTANGMVNTSDIGETKAISGQPFAPANFRNDVTVNGAINSSDISVIKANSGTQLPPAAASKAEE